MAVTSNVNHTKINWVVMDAVVKAAKVAVGTSAHPRKESWLRAIEKALAELQANPYWELQDDKLFFLSALSQESYEITGLHCSCKAAQHGRPCYHLASKRLLEIYAKQLAFPHVPQIQHDPKPKASPIPAGALIAPSLRQHSDKYGGIDI